MSKSSHSFRYLRAILLTTLISAACDASAQFSSSGATQLSVGYQGVAPDSFSGEVSAAPNGDITAFTSGSSNLLPNDSNALSDVFVSTPSKGLELISVSSVTGTFPAADSTASGSSNPAISSLLPDGNYAVAFTSDLRDIVPNYQSTGNPSINPRQIYLRFPLLNKTILISASRESDASTPRGANAPCDQVSVVALADPTRFIVVFRTTASNLSDAPPTPPRLNRIIHITTVGFENGAPKILRHEAADKLPNGNPIDSDLNHPAVSGDGRLVAFSTVAQMSQGVPTNGKEQVYIYDRSARQARLISVNASGNPGNEDSFRPSLSFQGEFLSFITRATDIIPRTSAGTIAVLFNARAKSLTQINLSSSGAPSNGSAYYARVSPGGKLVTFSDDGTNLVAAPTTAGSLQTYLKDPSGGAITLTSQTSTGIAGDGNSGGVPPSLAANAQAAYQPLAFGSLGFSSKQVFTVFRSAAQNLTTVGVSSETTPNVFRSTRTPPKPKFEKNAPIEAPPDVSIVSSLPDGRGASVTIKLQEFDDSTTSSKGVSASASTSSKLQYSVEIRKSASRDRVFRTTSRNSTTVRKLTPGKYTVRYRVSKTVGKTASKSKYSPKTTIEIT